MSDFRRLTKRKPTVDNVFAEPLRSATATLQARSFTMADQPKFFLRMASHWPFRVEQLLRDRLYENLWLLKTSTDSQSKPFTHNFCQQRCGKSATSVKKHTLTEQIEEEMNSLTSDLPYISIQPLWHY